MGLIEWIVVGAIVGGLARLFLSGPSPVGCLGTIFVGVVGAIAGGQLWRMLFGGQRGIAWIGAILMAMLLLAILRQLSLRR
jgi:uncharacterized membrane protein YeaQ/YmgE (transglycosylase-associated protein family)